MSKHNKNRPWSVRWRGQPRGLAGSIVMLMLAVLVTLVGADVGAGYEPIGLKPNYEPIGLKPNYEPIGLKPNYEPIGLKPNYEPSHRLGLVAQAPARTAPGEGKSENVTKVGRGSTNFLRQWLLRADMGRVTAPVILDGRQLFVVSEAEEATAAKRADGIETVLERAALSSGKLEVKVGESKAGPIIFVNDEYLLTVTRRDAVPQTPAIVAQTWSTDVKQALDKARRERTTRFMLQSLIHAVVALVLALVVHWGMTRMWQRYKPRLQELVARLPKPDGVDPIALLDGLLLVLQRLLRLAFWLGVGFYIANLFPLSRQWAYPIAQLLLRIPKIIVAIFTNTIFTLGQDPYSLSDLLVLSGLLFGLTVGAGKGSNLLRDRILHMTGINRGAREALATIAKYSAIALGTIVILQVWGVDLSSLTIIASALSVGIAFGFQDIAKNFASGLVLLFERPIQVGDFVEVGEYTGTVERIGSRSTTIRTLDRISIILPNSRFLENEVINWSHQDPISRIHIPVGVAYGSDIKAVETALLDTAKEHPHVLKVPPPRVMFKGFGDSAIDFELLVWSNMPEEQYWTKSDLYFRIEELFQERQIEIPFPQRDLHLRSGTLPLELSPELQQALLLLLQSLNNGYRK